jgi:CxxC-x17-CxxC domain-containing protein
LEKIIMGFDRPRSGGFGRDRDGGRGGFGGRGGGFGRGGGRGGGFRDRGPVEMHDAVCDKCKKECQVPFKPSEGKPVLCSECFSNAGGSRRDMNSSSGGGMSSDQFKQLNTKLDKILKILDEMEIVEEDDDGDLVEDEEDEDEDDVVTDEDEKNKAAKGLVEDSDEEDDEDDKDSEEDEKVVI